MTKNRFNAKDAKQTRNTYSSKGIMYFLSEKTRWSGKKQVQRDNATNFQGYIYENIRKIEKTNVKVCRVCRVVALRERFDRRLCVFVEIDR